MTCVVKDPSTNTLELDRWFDEALRELDTGNVFSSDWTEEVEENEPGVQWLKQRSSLNIHSAAALILFFVSQKAKPAALVGSLFDPFSVTVIETPDADWIEHVADAFESGLLPAMRRAYKYLPAVSVLTDRFSSASRNPIGRHKEFQNTLKDGISNAQPIVCIVRDVEAIPAPFRSSVSQVVRLAKVSRQVVLTLHQVIHRKEPDQTLKIASHKLPVDDALQLLTPDQLAVSVRPADFQKMAAKISSFAAGNVSASNHQALDEVKGLGASRALLEQLAADMQAWGRGELGWENIPRGVLLYGPPGTGKTFLAGKLAEQTGAHFIATGYSDWQRHGHLGDFLAAMRRSFDDASRHTPSVLFIDEIDSFEDRATATGENANYTRAALNGLLEAMDGATKNQGVLVIGACNHPEKLDRALVRSGRFDLKVALKLPGKAALAAILSDHAGSIVSQTAIVDAASHLVGCSGADAAALVRHAGSLARRNGRDLSDDDLLEAATIVSPQSAPKDIARIAYHEAGHSVVGFKLGLGVPLRAEVGNHGGSVTFRENDPNPTLPQMEAQLATLLAGREAEDLMLSSVSAGGGGGRESDLSKATLLAARLETQFGFGLEPLIWRPVTEENLSVLLQDTNVAKRIVAHLEAAQRQARTILVSQRNTVEFLARRLMSERELVEQDLATVLKGFKAPGPCPTGCSAVTV